MKLMALILVPVYLVIIIIINFEEDMNRPLLEFRFDLESVEFELNFFWNWTWNLLRVVELEMELKNVEL